MPSMLPILTYSVQSQDNDSTTSTTPSSHGGIEVSATSSRRSERKRSGKGAESVRKTESPSKDGKKSGKKKRHSSKRIASRNGATLDDGSSDKVEELVAKATAHAQAVQAVKKSILEIQLFLLDGVQDKTQLQATSALLTQSEYSDVVTERSISKQCGYPLCHNGLITELSRNGRYRISLHEHKVYDLTETRLFCCADHLVASKTFQSSLQIERDGFMRKEKLKRVMDYIRNPKVSKFHHGNGNSKDHQTLSVPSNDSLVSGIQEREDSGISNFDDAGPFDAIEGYVPQNSIRHWPSSKIAQQPEAATERGEDLERMTRRTLSSSPVSEPMSLDKEKSSAVLEELDAEISPETLLKSALKKGTAERKFKRSVSWEDQKKKDHMSERKDSQSPSRLKERSQVHHPISQSEHTSTASDNVTLRETTVAGDSVSLSSSPGRNAPDGQICESSILTSSGAGPVDTSAVSAQDSEIQKHERVISAEAVAAALTQAAEATAGGGIGCEEAVAQAGLYIVPVSEDVEISKPLDLKDLEEKSANDSLSSTEVVLRWPILQPPEEDDLDFTSAKGAWHSTPPKNFKVEVSMFGTIWMALEEWISAATIAHIYGKEPQDEDEFLIANGREFHRRAFDADSASAEIARTFSTCISRAFPDVVRALRLNVPMSILEQNIGRLVRTMTFVEALPAFSVEHWNMILMLLLDGLSVQRLPSVGEHLTNNMPLLRKRLDSPLGPSVNIFDCVWSLSCGGGLLAFQRGRTTQSGSCKICPSCLVPTSPIMYIALLNFLNRWITSILVCSPEAAGQAKASSDEFGKSCK